ncbi:MAG: hypothetical protein KDD67_00695 [Ignavibacteriae bacterium]|nr:hypothetical protein [Ignavibacteriota bacterium]MCB9216053.1 hypothetical protein [Ignavibacteria bacterium]
MSDKAEYQKLLQRWIDGGEVSNDEQRLLEQLLASDPEFAHTHQQLLRLEESVQVSRASLLRSGRGDSLRSTVDTLSRSVPSTLSVGGGVLAKIIGSAVVLIVAVTGVLLFVGRNSEPTPEQTVSTQSRLQEQISLEEDANTYSPIDSSAVLSEGQVVRAVEGRKGVAEGAKENSTLDRELPSLTEERMTDTPGMNPDAKSKEPVDNLNSPSIHRNENDHFKGTGVFESNKSGSNN